MGRYTSISMCELKLTPLLAEAVAFNVGADRARDHVVSLTRDEVASITNHLELMVIGDIIDLKDLKTIYSVDDSDTRGWYRSQLRNLEFSIGLLKSWLAAEEDTLTFC